jgi:ABC-type polysaccharide/polyol phosphate transport system ATPase subunit
MALIEAISVSKRFQRNLGGKLISERLKDLFRGGSGEQNFYAVRNVSFRIAEGESVALIGANGAGKSTLLSLVAGLAQPDEGTVHARGRIAAMLDLESGFHPDLTGIENIYLRAALLGLTERQTRDRLEKILEFAELGEQIHEPVRTFSSGMTLRLAFSLSAHSDPAILIVDEVLGVGDGHFQEKSSRKVLELRQQGVTLLCVSHDPQMVADFCERGMWLHQGQLMSDGPLAEIEQAYASFQSDSLEL